MKYIIVISLIFINFNLAYCQNQILEANYELKRELNGYKFVAKAITTKDNKSKTSLFKLYQFENLMKAGQKIYAEKLKDSAIVVNSGSSCTDPKEYYFANKEKKVTQILHNGNCKSKVLIEEELDYPKWEIQNEFKEISGYKTQKATAFLNDRTWTVYFTKDIKENIAPWKLIGLPGVIVEATENTAVYTFKLIKIQRLDKVEEIIRPTFSVKSSFKDYVSKSIKEERDENIYSLSQIEGITVSDIDPNTFDLTQTIDFIEKRKIKK